MWRMTSLREDNLSINVSLMMAPTKQRLPILAQPLLLMQNNSGQNFTHSRPK